MCGIIGAVAEENIVALLLDGLKRLEYRGYDSAGIAVIDANQHLQRQRAAGKITQLQALIAKEPMTGHIGLAHTRWATHGKPNKENAHPHIAGDEIALVHNGIIENHQVIRADLLQKGCHLTSETDSELVAHLIYLKVTAGQDFLAAARNTIAELQGTFAIGLMSKSEPQHLLALRKGSPLVIGLGDRQNFIASDTLALQAVATRFIYLEEGDIADIYANDVIIYAANNQRVERPIHQADANHAIANKGGYAHFMLKEIFEQPAAISSTLQGRIDKDQVVISAFGEQAADIFQRVRRIQIVACGTSYHAGLIGRFWLEELAKLPCAVDIASEYRYRQKLIEPNTLFITLSQSGETADTLAALHVAKNSGYLATLSICNVATSSIVRDSDLALMTDAGTEIGVASTKAFTTQLVALFLLSIALAKYQHLDAHHEAQLISQLLDIPTKVQQALNMDAAIKVIANNFKNKQNALFLGRGIEFPIALEGALKLKEISYIHAEAYPAGELKHGPLALVDAHMPVIALAPDDDLLDKLKSNLEEVHTRNGQLIIFADVKATIAENAATQVLIMPTIDRLLAPIIYTIPMQLLAYHVAELKGTDIDQPRNLAKSVTVE